MVQIGEIVHFVQNDGPEDQHGRCRPAIVTQVYDERHAPLDLTVFGDAETLVARRRYIRHAHPQEFGRWHTRGECKEGV